MPPHHKTDRHGKHHGQCHRQQVAAGGDSADEHELIHLHGQHDELVQRHTQCQTHAGADERQQLDLAEDVAVHLLIVEAQHLDGRQLLFALPKVDADEVIQHHSRQRRRADDDQHHHIAQTDDEIIEQLGGVLGKADAADVVAVQQVGAQGVVTGSIGAGGLPVDRVPRDLCRAQQAFQLCAGEVQPGEHIVFRDAGQGQLHPGTLGVFHPEGIAGVQSQVLGGLFGQDGAAAVKADGLVPLAGAEGDVPGQVAVLGGGHDAHACALAFGIVDGGGFGIHRAPVLHGAVSVQLLCQPLLHGQGFGVAEGNGHIVVGQLGRLLRDDGQQRVLNAKADEQQRGAARHAQHGHEEPLFIPEQVAGCGLLGEGHPLPQRGDALHQDALARHRGPGQQQSCGLFGQTGTAGVPCGKADDGSADAHAGSCHARVEVQGEGGQGEHQLIGVPDNDGEYHKAHHHADDAAQNSGKQRVKQILARDAEIGVAQRL